MHPHLRTCARADATQCLVYRERLDGLHLNLVRGSRSISYEFYTTHGRGASALAHMRTPFWYLGNGWTDCAEIRYVIRDQLARQPTQTKEGYICMCAPAHVQICSVFRILEAA